MCFYLSVKIEKNTKYIQVFEKVTQLATRALVAGRKKEKISKSEMTTLTYFDNLKKKKQDQCGKNWCYRRFYVTDNLKFQNYCILF